MKTQDTATPRALSFDGCGINGQDEYRTRIATFTNTPRAQEYGRLFAAAPELRDALEYIEAQIHLDPEYEKLPVNIKVAGHRARALLAKLNP